MSYFDSSYISNLFIAMGICVYGVLTGIACQRLAHAYTLLLNDGGQPDITSFNRAVLLSGRQRPGWIKSLIPAVVMTGSFVCFYAQHGWSVYFLALTVASLLLLSLALIDLQTGLLPDALTFPLLLLGLALAWFDVGISLHDALMGAMAGYGFLWLAARAFRHIRGTQGMGNGDLKLVAGLGAWVGLSGLIPTVLLASLVGLGFAMLHQRSLRPNGSYPFGPFLAGAGLGVLLVVS